ncbi:hypothetical protein, partial [Chitinophaga sancti]|uniref:hypothetical protein n=1 Tax=Chitinophaga sancti TaxID=1004 RepID=UPI001C432A45
PRHPCLWLMIRTATLIQDLHLRAYNHAWRTSKGVPDLVHLFCFMEVLKDSRRFLLIPQASAKKRLYGLRPAQKFRYL